MFYTLSRSRDMFFSFVALREYNRSTTKIHRQKHYFSSIFPDYDTITWKHAGNSFQYTANSYLQISQSRVRRNNGDWRPDYSITWDFSTIKMETPFWIRNKHHFTYTSERGNFTFDQRPGYRNNDLGSLYLCTHLQSLQCGSLLYNYELFCFSCCLNIDGQKKFQIS